MSQNCGINWKDLAPRSTYFSVETAEIFLPIIWAAFAPLVVLVFAIEWFGDRMAGEPDEVDGTLAES
jgi:hypothetical protein